MSALDELDRLRRRDPDLAEELARVVMDLLGVEPEPGLTRAETVIVRTLKAARGAIVPTEGLTRAIDLIREPTADPTDPRAILPHMFRIRSKIKAGRDLGGWPEAIRGFGYRWAERPAPTDARPVRARAAAVLDALRGGKPVACAELQAVAYPEDLSASWRLTYCIKILRADGHPIRLVGRRAYLLEAA